MRAIILCLALILLLVLLLLTIGYALFRAILLFTIILKRFIP